MSAELRRARPLLGTFVEIEASGADESDMMAAIDAAFQTIARAHDLMSFHQADSDVGRLNREAHLRPTRVHSWTFRVLEAAVELHRRSNGIFDIAVAPALQALGLLPRTGGDHPTAGGARIFDSIELFPDHAVRFHQAGVAIDLGGIAKGFAVDRALEVLHRFGIPGAIVNAGGDLAAYGAKPHVVHLRHPRKPDRLICSVEVASGALASSARRFDPLHDTQTASSAIIDPITGQPPQKNDGATVRASSCMIADALTKTVMIAGTEADELLEHYQANALVISADGDLHITSDWHHAVHLAA